MGAVDGSAVPVGAKVSAEGGLMGEVTVAGSRGGVVAVFAAAAPEVKVACVGEGTLSCGVAAGSGVGARVGNGVDTSLFWSAFEEVADAEDPVPCTFSVGTDGCEVESTCAAEDVGSSVGLGVCVTCGRGANDGA